MKLYRCRPRDALCQYRSDLLSSLRVVGTRCLCHLMGHIYVFLILLVFCFRVSRGSRVRVRFSNVLKVTVEDQPDELAPEC